MASNFCTLSLGQLKTELRRRNAKLTGRKKELIERLEAYDRNQNFNREEDLLPEFNMSLPKTSGYRDLKTELRRRNAKLTGRKKELIERLEAYDRNQNFNREEDLLPEFNMSLPKTSGYRD
ncbi:hypothetical protein MAR_031788, partial [Mya arenaria]